MLDKRGKFRICHLRISVENSMNTNQHENDEDFAELADCPIPGPEHASLSQSPSQKPGKRNGDKRHRNHRSRHKKHLVQDSGSQFSSCESERMNNDVGKGVEFRACHLLPLPSSSVTRDRKEQPQLQDINSECRMKDTKSMTLSCDDSSNIEFLPDDILFLIFQYLQPQDLFRLCCVCRRFNYLASKDSVWNSHTENEIILHNFKTLTQRANSIRSRIPTRKELMRVASIWKSGKFSEYYIARHKIKFIPWIYKDDTDLWFSTGNCIRNFQMDMSGKVKENKKRQLGDMHSDATQFVVKDAKVVSGSRDGSIYGWQSLGAPLFTYRNVHTSDTQCLDFTDRIIVSGSRDSTCKILPLELERDVDPRDAAETIDVSERVWSLKISPCQSFFAVGLAGCTDEAALVIWDLESGESIQYKNADHQRGAGILDIKFESPFELLTCGYDSFIRLWDTRTQQCVRKWEEPFNSALYCIESAGNNYMVVGTSRHGMVRLWDKRMTGPVQLYYSKNSFSPVYSLAVDYGHIFMALERGFNIMDFTKPAVIASS